jgi:minor histocompatibility antigen H13
LGSAFPKTYFHASIVGYAVGMMSTLAILLWFKHGQPALLYLVPSVVGSIFLTAWARGELKELWLYTEDGSLDKEDVVVDVGPNGKKSNGQIEQSATPVLSGKTKSSSKASRNGLIFQVSLRIRTASLTEGE